NAAKFTTAPGRVELTVAREPGILKITVRDHRIGISPDALPHVFDMFYQSDSTPARIHGGLGIGLYLVRRLVELHGGSVEARSGPERQGTELIVRLPALPTASGPVRQTTARSVGKRPQTERSRVLIVDDNKDSADALAKLLGGAGHEVEVQYDGASAVDAAERTRPDVILLDLGMPNLDGYEVCRRVRQQ